MTDNHIPSGSKNYIFHTLLDYCMQERANVVWGEKFATFEGAELHHSLTV